ncbi:GTPase Era [Candidatus Westeberhardia cardiocondylae]|uniref:GTPase Era n=2 Tax=Candidatus Westeberhardia cardiocondylae TaxID=1594731 RepID=A0A0H5C596_9ENTR|nr:GTPase Era [Candidatus Westeberhardia cardiocondylae]
MIIGRFNVGKSTLLNRMLGKKISIVSSKRNTTIFPIAGVVKDDLYQCVYIDTPGLYIQKKQNIDYFKDVFLNVSISSSMINIIFFVIDIYWTHYDELIYNKLVRFYNNCQVILIINKIDNFLQKSKVLPYIQFLSKKINFDEVVPISAKKNININTLFEIVKKKLSKLKCYFPNEITVNYSNNFFASEIVREKIMQYFWDEIPYSVVVKIEPFLIDKNFNNFCNIYGFVFVFCDMHKKMIIGKEGRKIKKIIYFAKKDMEIVFSSRVNLKLCVKRMT